MSRLYDTIVLDLDGTLLGRDGRVSKQNRAAVDRARAEGYRILVATGRALIETRDALRALDHDDLVIAAGGSLLCEASSGRTIDRRVLGQDLVAEATTRLNSHGHKVLILKDSHRVGYDYITVGPGSLDAASQWWFSQHQIDIRHLEDIALDPHPEDSIRVGVVAHGERIAPVADDLRIRLGDRVFLQHWAAVTESEATGSETHLLEVFHAHVNKWTMVVSYCERYDAAPERIVAIGDGLNDVELVANAGLGIAMGNADPRVRAVAGRHTSDHDAHGVAEAINRILIGDW